jgi:hypothetical protein
MQQSSDPAPVVGDWVFSQTIGGDEAAYFIKSVAPGGRFLQIYCVGGKYFLRVFPWPAKGPAGAMRATIGVDRDFTAGQGIGLGGQIDAERGVFEAELSVDVLADIAAAQNMIFVAGVGLDWPLEFPRKGWRSAQGLGRRVRITARLHLGRARRLY